MENQETVAIDDTIRLTVFYKDEVDPRQDQICLYATAGIETATGRKNKRNASADGIDTAGTCRKSRV